MIRLSSRFSRNIPFMKYRVSSSETAKSVLDTISMKSFCGKSKYMFSEARASSGYLSEGMQRSWKLTFFERGRMRSMVGSACSSSTSPSGSDRRMFNNLSQKAVVVPSCTTSTGRLVSNPTFRSVAWSFNSPLPGGQQDVGKNREGVLRGDDLLCDGNLLQKVITRAGEFHHSSPSYLIFIRNSEYR